MALDFEVDEAFVCAEFDVFDSPGRLQTKGYGEQGFRAQAHGGE